jgi:broad specificity phosphatase PhoE
MTDHYQIYFLRHGLSTANQAGIIQGQHDYPLSELGKYQAKALGEYWSAHAVAFDLIISSPLERARATATWIQGSIGGEIECDAGWLERQLGEAQGRTYETLHEDSAGMTASGYEPPFPGAESEWDLYMRAASSVQNIFRNSPGQYLVVSHVAILSAAMRAVFGQPPAAGRVRPARFSFHNTGHSHLTYELDSATWSLHYHNQTRHLEEQAGQV